LHATWQWSFGACNCSFLEIELNGIYIYGYDCNVYTKKLRKKRKRKKVDKKKWGRWGS